VFISARAELKTGIKTVLLWTALGFGAAFFKVGSGYTPFAAALVGALPFLGGISAAIGALIAGVVMLPDVQGGIVLLSAGLALAARVFFRENTPEAGFLRRRWRRSPPRSCSNTCPIKRFSPCSVPFLKDC